MTNHNFRATKELTKHQGMTIFWCKKCDSKVLFNSHRTERDVNQAMDRSNLKCMAPIITPKYN
jgi:hypothetical protein